MKKGFAVAIVLLSVLLVQLGISGLDVEMIDMRYDGTQPVDAEKAEMFHGTDLRMVKPVEMVPGEYRKFESVKKRAGESIVLGGGYTLEITGVDPEDDKVSMELKLDNTVIDSKALEIGSSFVYKDMDIGKIKGVVEGTVEVEKCCFLGPLYFLSIRSLPQGAIIFIDGEERGSTPNERIGPWFMDEHTLHLKLEGYEDAERTFQFDPERVEEGILEMEIALKEIQYTPSVTSPPVTSPPVTSPPVPLTPTPVPGFLAITFIIAILCGYLILKKTR